MGAKLPIGSAGSTGRVTEQGNPVRASHACAPYNGNTVSHDKIHLAVGKQKDLVIQARDGYYFGQ